MTCEILYASSLYLSFLCGCWIGSFFILWIVHSWNIMDLLYYLFCLCLFVYYSQFSRMCVCVIFFLCLFVCLLYQYSFVCWMTFWFVFSLFLLIFYFFLFFGVCFFNICFFVLVFYFFSLWTDLLSGLPRLLYFVLFFSWFCFLTFLFCFCLFDDNASILCFIFAKMS